MSYTDLFSTDPNNFSMAMPTVNTQAAVSGAGVAPVNTGIASPVVGAGGAPVVAPAGPNNAASNPSFFSEFGPAQFALGAVQTLGSLWNSFQQNKLAKESFNFQKDAYNENLANQEQSYNTALEDRINARYVTEGKSQAEADAYIEANRL